MSFVYTPIKLRKSLENLKYLCTPPTGATAVEQLDVTRAVESFKFSYELLWRLLRRILEEEGLKAATPGMAFNLALQRGLAKNPEAWRGFDAIRQDLGTYLETSLPEKIAADFLMFYTEASAIILSLEQPEAA